LHFNGAQALNIALNIGINALGIEQCHRNQPLTDSIMLSGVSKPDSGAQK